MRYNGVSHAHRRNSSHERAAAASSSALAPPYQAARILAENVARVTDTVVPVGLAEVSTWAPS
jgi:hypothetical protein